MYEVCTSEVFGRRHERGFVLFGNGSIDNTGAGGSTQIRGPVLVTTNPPTTTSAANARIGASGLINMVTSLSKHKLKKKAVRLADVAGVLKLKPTSWFDRGEWLANGRSTEGLRRITGLIAEQVEEVAPEFAEYDVQGHLAGVDHRAVAVAMLPILADQQARIEALEARIAK